MDRHFFYQYEPAQILPLIGEGGETVGLCCCHLVRVLPLYKQLSGFSRFSKREMATTFLLPLKHLLSVKLIVGLCISSLDPCGWKV